MKDKHTDIGYADLHVHTTYSDGMFTPLKVVETALEKGIGAIAVTDHDCVDGVAPTVNAAEGTDLVIIPGIELSAAAEDSEIHILGYFIDHKCPVFAKILGAMRDKRTVRIREMIKRLAEKDIHVDADKVFGAVTDGTIGRMHLARVMVDQNLAFNIREAFEKFIGDGKPFHVKHERLDYIEAIKIIRKAGGVPVLAHPGNMGKDEYIPKYVKAGLMGIEVYHSEHRLAAIKKYEQIAQEHGLIMTGGSDCHGYSKWGGKREGKVLMGKVTVGKDVVDALKTASQKIRERKA